MNRTGKTVARIRAGFVLAGAVTGAHVLVGCSMEMIATLPIQDASGQTCKSAAGAYFLPKKHIVFNITQADGTSPYVLTFSSPAPVADRTRMYCLDYLASALADDTVHVNRDANGLLQTISSVADDKSKAIAEALIQTGVIAATGNPNFGFRAAKIKAGAVYILAEYSIDPFDRDKLAVVNATLGPTYGYCIVVNGYTVHPDDVQAYCDNPLATRNAGQRKPMVFKAPPALVELPALAPEVESVGVLYRPNLTHEILVYRRYDPGSRKVWQLLQTARVEMPNVAPVFSIGVERSAFVKRTTRLDFDSGVLSNVTIEKPSELLEFMEIPLVLAQALVAIPAEILKVRVASTNNQKLLIDAQRELLATQRAYVGTLRDLRAGSAGGAGTDGLRSAALRGTSGTPRALQQIPPDPMSEIRDACTMFCRGSRCIVDVCINTATSKCQDQELSICLPAQFP